MTIQDIFPIYRNDLTLVEKNLKEIFWSDAPLLPMIGEHIVEGGGKRLRPLFLLLSADLAGYRGENRIILASIIEAIHTASLLHDDVVDGAELRRGKQTAHMLWGNQIVILVGDFLYSNALRLAVLQGNQKVMEALSEATTMMTEGEILQLNKVADPEITEEEYYRIISAKTGALISAACRIGGIIGGLSDEKEDALARFGMKIGMAFQMVDDILDYMADEKGLGKKLGKDLDEGKITLPLIYLLGVAAAEETTEIKEMIRNGVTDEKDLKRILHLFEVYSVIEKSHRIAQELVREAKNELTLFPPSSEKDALMGISDYALERDK
jgi:octaprenyl-diphosphate synthase